MTTAILVAAITLNVLALALFLYGLLVERPRRDRFMAARGRIAAAHDILDLVDAVAAMPDPTDSPYLHGVRDGYLTALTRAAERCVAEVTVNPITPKETP